MTSFKELIAEARGYARELRNHNDESAADMFERLAAALASVPASLPAPREPSEAAINALGVVLFDSVLFNDLPARHEPSAGIVLTGDRHPEEHQPGHESSAAEMQEVFAPGETVPLHVWAREYARKIKDNYATKGTLMYGAADVIDMLAGFLELNAARAVDGGSG